MPVSELLELARSGGYDRFESRCLELLESGTLTLGQLVGPFEELERAGQAERLATLTQMVLENADATRDPAAALALVRVALIAAPKNDDLRRTTIELYRRLYGQTPGFEVVLAASGINGGRPVRNALKLLDLCLSLQPGDTLISRMDDRVVEVAEIDREKGLFTLRREGRTTTVPAPEVTREYDRIAPDDFRVLRQLRPEQLTSKIEDDPVGVVIGLIRAHDGHIDADLLKHELVPKYIETRDWSRWWTKARGLLKRSPHVVIEGRAPVILSYCAAGQTHEEETWDALQGQNDPIEWMSTIESYLREKASRHEPPDEAFLRRFHEHVIKYIAAVESRRPAEALAGALVVERLSEKGLPSDDASRGRAVAMLRAAADPGLLLRGVEHEGLRERGLDALRAARPDDWAQYALAWLPTATAGLLDKIVAAAVAAGHADVVQTFIDTGLSNPVAHHELLYWLWKGPKQKDQLRLPSDDELFRLILDELSALGRTVTAAPEVVKAFRQRMKTALAIRDYDKARQCLQRASEAAAITLRRQLQRLEGLGENVPAKLLDLLRDVHPQLWVVQRQQVAPWEDRETLWCTSEGLARRTAERDEIVNVKMPENAKRIGEAASHGDLSENSEYKFALEERDLLRARVAAINDELSRARTLTPHDVPHDQVGIGSRVTVRAVSDGRERVMTFLGPFETDVERGIYSYLAPVSQKLMGRQVGDRVVVTADGADTEWELIGLANALTTH
ncbi:MAG: GreA/GreB family elongation factor [Phycisphaerae bacterium]|nr:GreA/GreB family elongation factor [Phycisphaerae bacterium]